MFGLLFVILYIIAPKERNNPKNSALCSYLFSISSSINEGGGGCC